MRGEIVKGAGRHAHCPKSKRHEFGEKWCYTEVHAHHIADFGDLLVIAFTMFTPMAIINAKSVSLPIFAPKNK